MKFRAWLALLVVSSVVATSAAAAGEVEDAVAATSHSPAQYAATLDTAVLDGLAPLGPPPAITGDAELDARIRAIAEARGYKLRANPNRDLVTVDGRFLQPEAAAGWLSLKAAAAANGHFLSLTSAYRNVASQFRSFRQRLNGTSDASIDTVLRTVAAPGYSKHHTGYTIDIKSSTAFGFAFRGSPAYAWMAADNFANTKAHGWIPSYPEGAVLVGPNPEPWEFVWVGAINIICGDFQPNADQPFCDTVGSTFAVDIDWLHTEQITVGCRAGRFCTSGLLTRGQAATMMWRMVGSPDQVATSTEFSDVPDNAYYSAPVRWMVDNRYTTGTSPTTFDPDLSTTRAQFVTFLWRLAGRPEPVGEMPFGDVDPSGFAGKAVTWAAEQGITRGTSATEFSPDATATRGEASAFLHRYFLATTR